MKHLKLTRAGLLASALCAAQGAWAATELVSNGSFELGTAITATDWTDNNVQFVGPGDRDARFANNIDSLFQIFAGPIAAGTSFDVSFDFDNRTIGGGPLNFLTYALEYSTSPTFAGGGTVFGQATLGPGSLDGLYGITSVILPVASYVRIYFDSLSFQNFRIDDVSVTAVPEPETYALMLAGLGVIGFIARRRRPNQG